MAVNLFIGFNVFITIIILYNNAIEQKKSTTNQNSVLYESNTKPLFDDTYDFFILLLK